MTKSVEIFGDTPSSERRSWPAIWRGINRQCPQCGRGQLFEGYIKTRPACECCGLDFSGHQADDAPPYLTILIVGHLAIPLALASKQLFDPPMWMQFLTWLPIMIISSLLILPASKGAMIGLQWANRMHGFGSNSLNSDI